MISWLLTKVLGWLSSGGLEALAQIYAKGKDSQVAGERIAADLAKAHIDALIEAQRQAVDVRLATAGFWEMRLITGVIASCFTLHLVLVTLDTCFAFGWRIPAYPPPFDGYQGDVLLSFFALQAGLKVIDVLGGAIARRK